MIAGIELAIVDPGQAIGLGIVLLVILAAAIGIPTVSSREQGERAEEAEQALADLVALDPALLAAFGSSRWGGARHLDRAKLRRLARTHAQRTQRDDDKAELKRAFSALKAARS